MGRARECMVVQTSFAHEAEADDPPQGRPCCVQEYIGRTVGGFAWLPWQKDFHGESACSRPSASHVAHIPPLAQNTLTQKSCPRMLCSMTCACTLGLSRTRPGPPTPRSACPRRGSRPCAPARARRAQPHCCSQAQQQRQRIVLRCNPAPGQGGLALHARASKMIRFCAHNKPAHHSDGPTDTLKHLQIMLHIVQCLAREWRHCGATKYACPDASTPTPLAHHFALASCTLPPKVPTWIHFVALHFSPLVTGQLPCRLLSSSSVGPQAAARSARSELAPGKAAAAKRNIVVRCWLCWHRKTMRTGGRSGLTSGPACLYTQNPHDRAACGHAVPLLCQAHQHLLTRSQPLAPRSGPPASLMRRGHLLRSAARL